MDMLEALTRGDALPVMEHQLLDTPLPITPETDHNRLLLTTTAKSADDQEKISFTGRHAVLKQRMQSTFEGYSK